MVDATSPPSKSYIPKTPHSSSTFIPTSITTAPSATYSGFIILAEPAAATSISACLHVAAISTVFVCTTVTVAFLFIRSIATGLPITRLLPTTVTLLPLISTPA